MTEDARFEDGAERALRLKGENAEDVPVIAALTQDAVLSANEMSWDQRTRRFSLLLNRFRWEDKATAERRGRGFERVQSVFSVGDVVSVKHQGISARNKDTILSLLDISFEPDGDGTGRVILTFAGDGAIAIEVEAVNLVLQDVTRPYLAPSKSAPTHPE